MFTANGTQNATNFCHRCNKKHATSPLKAAQVSPTQLNATQLNSSQPNSIKYAQPNSSQPDSTQSNSTHISTQLSSTQPPLHVTNLCFVVLVLGDHIHAIYRYTVGRPGYRTPWAEPVLKDMIARLLHTDRTVERGSNKRCREYTSKYTFSEYSPSSTRLPQLAVFGADTCSYSTTLGVP